MYDTPIVRLEVERMKFGMMHAIQSYHADLEKKIAAELEKAIANFDFAAEVQREAKEAIRQVVAQEVRQAVHSLLQDQIAEEVRQKILGRLKE